MYSTTLYIALYGFAIYFSNFIYSKAILISLILFCLLYKNSNIKINLLIAGILAISFYNVFFISFIFPFLPKDKSTANKVFLNTLLIRFIIENSYYTGFNYVEYLYYFWGVAFLITSYIITLILKKYSSHTLICLALFSIIGQIYFNYNLSKQNCFTISQSEDSIVANHTLMHKYFPKIKPLDVKNIKNESNGFFIVPLVENDEIIKQNYIFPQNTYLLLAEHDNMNNFLKYYPYFNNDAYQINTPWNLYKPNFIHPFKYITDKDLFYASNIGASVKSGFPLIWDYNIWGKLIILASIKNINGSKVFLWGDSDFLVSKLIPYNINFVEKILENSVFLYPVYAIAYILFLILLIKNKEKYYTLFGIISIVLYILPIETKADAEIKLYSQFKFHSAHNEAHVSSIMNLIAKDNITIINSKNKSNLLILTKSENIDNFQNASLIYMMSGASLKIENDTLICSNLKIGTEEKTNTIDTRLLIKNQTLLNTGHFKYNNIDVVCTGSPQLNLNYTKDKFINEK